MTPRALYTLLVTLGIFLVVSVLSWIYIKIRGRKIRDVAKENIKRSDSIRLVEKANEARKRAEEFSLSE